MSLGEALEMGRSLHRQGLLPEAESVYREILSRKPRQPEALHFLGVLVDQTGRSDEAAQLILAALELDPGYVDAFSNLGNVLRHLDRNEEAETAYRRAIELKPDFADAHLNLSALLYEREQYEQALVECRRAIELSPDMWQPHVVAGSALARQGHCTEAADSYLQAIQRRKFHAGVYENMAMSLLRLGRTGEAIEIYRRWLSVDPDNPRPRHHLAACTGIDVPPRAPDDYLREVFNGFAPTFDKQLGSLSYAAPALVIEAVANELGPPLSNLAVLDAGCGTGLCGAGIRPFARRLEGVDLSAEMLKRAHERGLYDELHEAELTQFMSCSPAAYDVIISADTLIYFGDLSAVIAAAAGALRPGGRIVFTVEKADPESAPPGFRIHNHGRYSHTDLHVRQAIERAGLEAGPMPEVLLRTEGRERVMGWLATGRETRSGAKVPHSAAATATFTIGP
jgi:predicted TPR repeat methyltransferase